jgi:hypothetical protein
VLCIERCDEGIIDGVIERDYIIGDFILLLELYFDCAVGFITLKFMFFCRIFMLLGIF